MNAEQAQEDRPLGEWSASESDAKRDRESVQACPPYALSPIQSGSGIGPSGAPDAAASAAAPAHAGLPCLSSNNYPISPYKLRKTAVTYEGKPGAAVEVVTRTSAKDAGFDREGRLWEVGADGLTWEQYSGPTKGPEAKRAFALRSNLEAFFDYYGRSNSAFFTLSPPSGTKPRELAQRFNDARKRRLPWMRSYVRVLEPRRDGTAHHHLAVATDFDMRPDSFDWEAFKTCQEHAPCRGVSAGPLFHEMRRRYVASAPKELQECWKLNKEVCDEYGLGRAEMLPLRTCSEAVARYVGAYLDSGTRYRNKDWKGARRVEYDRKESLRWKRCGSALAFVSPGSKEWRTRVGELALATCVDPDDFVGLRRTHGRSWAYDLRPTIMTTNYEDWCEFLWYMVEVYDGTMPKIRLQPIPT